MLFNSCCCPLLKIFAVSVLLQISSRNIFWSDGEDLWCNSCKKQKFKSPKLIVIYILIDCVLSGFRLYPTSQKARGVLSWLLQQGFSLSWAWDAFWRQIFLLLLWTFRSGWPLFFWGLQGRHFGTEPYSWGHNSDSKALLSSWQHTFGLSMGNQL